MKPHIFYDWDGTFNDSLSAHIKFLHDMNKRFGCGANLPDPNDKEACKKIVDPSSMMGFLKSAGLPITLVNPILEIYKTDFNKDEKYHSSLFPGIPEMIRRLSSETQQGIISANYRQNILNILKRKNLQHFLFPIVDRIELDEFHSGSKAKYLKFYMHTQELIPEQIIYVGDTSGDLKSAEEAGVSFIGVGYGWELSPKDNIDFPIAESPEHLEDLLFNHNF